MKQRLTEFEVQVSHQHKNIFKLINIKGLQLNNNEIIFTCKLQSI